MKNKRYYVLSPSSSEAMKLYQKVREAKIPATMAPTPRNADHCCGVCILYKNIEDQEKIDQIAKDNNYKIDDFWETEITDNPNRNKFC